jgi:hypothetical protein
MGLITWTTLAQTFISISSAQNSPQNYNATCELLSRYSEFNASVTRGIPALTIRGSQPNPEDADSSKAEFAVVNDTSRTWTLKLGVQKSKFTPDTTNYVQSLLLDTGDSDLTHMGSCHQTIEAYEPGRGYRWPKELLERSLDDNGDCMTFLGSECVAALKRMSAERAVQAMRRGSCPDSAGEDKSVPPECEIPIMRNWRTY